MESLPLLALELVCVYLTHSEPNRASLLAFASASRACRGAARRELFHQVSIDVDDLQDFHTKLNRLGSILDETKSRSWVRVLKVGMSTTYECEDDETRNLCGTSMRSISTYHGNPPSLRWRPRREPRPDEWWQPLVQFISSIHLKDLIWASTEQIPGCVLSVLEKQIPRCRLHVDGFKLYSLCQRAGLSDVEDAEYRLATSPCLHSIITLYSRYDASGCADYNGEASYQLAAGLAPNLKHVCMSYNAPPSYGEIRIRREDVRPKWRGFHPQSGSEWCEPPESKGRLQALVIDSPIAVSVSQIVRWENHTDFSALRSLTLARQIELEVLQNLASLAEQDELCCLTALDLPAVACEYEDRGKAESTMAQLLLSLKPLVELSLVAIAGSAYGAVIEKHGERLQVFRVEDFILSPLQVAQLRDSCPKVRELRIEILRSAGDNVEVDMYRSLGSMRDLESLSLILKCTDYRPGDGPDDFAPSSVPSEEEEDQKAMAVAIRQVFVNAAVDESLARSIFREMLTTHSAIKADLPPTLSCIYLKVAGTSTLCGQHMYSDFQGVLAWIGKSWSCRRDPRDTHQNKIIVYEVDINRRLRGFEDLENDLDELYGSEQYAGIWDSLWPKTRAGWKEGWQSFPLTNVP